MTSSESFAELRSQIVELRCTATSADDMVRATVDSAGALTDLTIADSAHAPTGAGLAECVMATVRAAQRDIPERIEQLLSTTIPEDSATADALLDGFRARFPDAHSGGEVETQPPQPATQATDDEDYFSRSPLDDS